MIRCLAACLLAFVCFGAQAQSASRELSPLGEKIRAAMDAPIRTEADKARDRNRKPIETLEFFRLQPDMRVLELVPGGGWYTKILAPVLRDEGKLYVAIGTGGIESGLLTEPGFEAVEVVGAQLESGGRVNRRNDLTAVSLDVSDIDLAVTFRNLHNFTEGGREKMNAAVFDALSPGGYYGVIDHNRRHMAADTYETWRRMDPVQMIKEIEAVGFEFVDYSDLHYRPDDELRYEVGRATVTGNTDRFTLLFRKPE
jgi:predicted methyltransferase